MKIYLARHGDYENGPDDFTRGLSKKGRADIAAVAGALKEKGVNIHKTIHSGKLRAQQTAEILADFLMPATVLDKIDGLNPDDQPDSFVAEHFSDLPADTLIVGHLPFMGRMVSLLLTGNPDQSPQNFQAGTVVCVEQTGSGAWTRHWTINPGDI